MVRLLGSLFVVTAAVGIGCQDQSVQRRSQNGEILILSFLVCL